MSTRSRRLRSLALLAAGTLLAAGAHAASNTSQSTSKGPVYKWVDDQGVVHYGDEIPTQAATKQRDVLNSQGVPVGHVDAEKSPDQLAAEARDKAAVVRQKQHDYFLVTTYGSVKDIEALRDTRLEQMRIQRAAAQQYVESLQARLGTLQTRAGNFRPYSASPDARRMPDDLAEDLVQTLNEWHVQTAALAAKSEQETSLRAQFQADIERYRELHTIHN
jgi:hypothetical protein